VALVRSIERISMERNTVHDGVRATYCVFLDNRGDAYLQIDTYGSSRRQIPDKKSQTIQFGPEALGQLREILGSL
jgi:hypothetical protein